VKFNIFDSPYDSPKKIFNLLIVFVELIEKEGKKIKNY